METVIGGSKTSLSGARRGGEGDVVSLMCLFGEFCEGGRALCLLRSFEENWATICQVYGTK